MKSLDILDLRANLHNYVSYQRRSALDKVANFIEEDEAQICTLILVGPSKSGKSITCHFINWTNEVQKDCLIVVNTSDESSESLFGIQPGNSTKGSLAQRLCEAAKNEPPLIMLILDDIDKANGWGLRNMASLFENGLLVTLSGAYFKLPAKTKLLVLITCKYESDYITTTPSAYLPEYREEIKKAMQASGLSDNDIKLFGKIVPYYKSTK